MACANVNGTIKLPLVFIHTPSSHVASRILTRVIFLLCTEEFLDVCNHLYQMVSRHFVPKCRKDSEELGLPPAALLALDNAPSHLDINSVASNDGLISCLYCHYALKL